MINTGLKKLAEDRRDYSFHRTFGASGQVVLPASFAICDPPLRIKNQYETDLCTAEAATEIEEGEKSAAMSAEWFFSKEKQIMGNPQAYGADLRTACKAAQKFGFLPQSDAPFTLDDQTRDFIADWKNWPVELDAIAATNKIAGYFQVEEFAGDLFDSIRQTLYQNQSSRRSILSGSNWYAEWNIGQPGIIPTEYSERVAQHAFKIFGWEEIAGVTYLMVQNSEGTESGNNGILYFPREVVNREFTFGVFCFSDVPENPVVIGTISIITAILNWLKGFFR